MKTKWEIVLVWLYLIFLFICAAVGCAWILSKLFHVPAGIGWLFLPASAFILFGVVTRGEL